MESYSFVFAFDAVCPPLCVEREEYLDEKVDKIEISKPRLVL